MEENAHPTSESAPIGRKVSAYLHSVVSVVGIASGLAGIISLASNIVAWTDWLNALLNYYRRVTAVLFEWLPFDLSLTSQDAIVLLALSAVIGLRAARYFSRPKPDVSDD
jgi:uncharacterized membrane protein required for colicin V production